MKRVLSLILSVLMIASVMVLPTFAADTGAALNDLADYGQKIFDLSKATTSPTVNGVVATGEYTDSKATYQTGVYGNVTIYTAHDANNIFFAVSMNEAGRGGTPTANGGNIAAGSALRLYINFPSEFTAKDANNYLVMHFNHMRGNVSGVQAYGDAEFVAKMNAVLGDYISATPKDFAGGGTGGNVTNTLIAAGLVTGIASGVSGRVITWEIAFSKAKCQEIFGWDGKTDMTVMAWTRTGNAWGTAMYEEGIYANANAAAALEAYSAANGDATAVNPYIAGVSNNQAAAANYPDVIPDVVRFTAPVEKHALNDLASYGQHQVALNEYKSPVIDGAVSAAEYTDAQQMYQVNNATYKNIGPYMVYTAHDVKNIYFGISHNEGARKTTPTANGGNPQGGSAVRIYLNFPSEFTASDANNYLVFHFNFDRGNVKAINAYGDAEFVAKMNEKIGELLLGDTDFYASTYQGNGWIGSTKAGYINNSGIISGIASTKNSTHATMEVAFSKVKLMEIFGWNGQSDMTYMAWVRSGNGNWGTHIADAGVYGNAAAAESLEAYSAAKGDNAAVAPWVTSVASNGIVSANNADVIPSVMKFQNVNYGSMKDAASARLNSTDSTKSGLRFKSYWNNEFLAAYAGQEVEIGTLITLASYVEQAGEFTHAALGALGVDTPYVEAVAGEAFHADANEAMEGMTMYAGSIVNLKSYTRDYAARGYVKVGDAYFYTDNYVVRNIATIAQATLDASFTAETPDEVNVYAVVMVDGTTKYSKYDQSMYDQLVAFAG